MYTPAKEVDLYNMNVHDQYHVRDGAFNYSILRVPGGWIYSFDWRGYSEAPCVFVPLTLEGEQ